MIICGFDLESTGVDPKEASITEIGAVLADVRGTDFRVLATYNNLVYEPDYPPQSEEVVEVTGITDADLKKYGVTLEEAYHQLQKMFAERGVPQAFMAHNAEYDKTLWETQLKKRLNIGGGLSSEQPWICTYKDMVHPKRSTSRKLSHLALDYGVAVDPSKLHRAIGDVSLMFDMVQASGVDIESLYQRSLMPTVTIRALVPSPFGARGDGGAGKEKAKACGFRWDGSQWVKQVKQNEIQEEEKNLGYKTTIIQS